MVNYNRLWKMLIDRNMKKTDLIKMAEISSATLAKMSNNQTVSLETLIKICELLECDLSDICSVSTENVNVKL